MICFFRICNKVPTTKSVCYLSVHLQEKNIVTPTSIYYINVYVFGWRRRHVPWQHNKLIQICELLQNSANVLNTLWLEKK